MADQDDRPRRGLAAGELVGDKYRLVRPAGFGGMGAVWVARNEATGAEVALKVLLASRAAWPELSARFRREAHAAAQLQHRGIVRVFDLVELAGKDAGTLVMVMELLRGETLGHLRERQKTLSLAQTLEIALPILSALAHAHAAGIVHRDLKPENVFVAVDPDGHVTPKILDFGISKLMTPSAPKITQDGATLGTPSYMSPEQVRGAADLDARSDVFTMGIVLYELLAGVNPFANDSYHSVVASILERDPPPLANVPPPVWLVLQRALQKNRLARFDGAREFAVALREAAERAGVVPTSTALPALVQIDASSPGGGATSARGMPSSPHALTQTSLRMSHVRERRHVAAFVAGGVVLVAALVGTAAFVGRRLAPNGDAVVAPRASSSSAAAFAPVRAEGAAPAPASDAIGGAPAPDDVDAPRPATSTSARGTAAAPPRERDALHAPNAAHAPLRPASATTTVKTRPGPARDPLF